MIVANLVFKGLFPLVGCASVGYAGKVLWDFEQAAKIDKPTRFVSIVGKVVNNFADTTTDGQFEMIKNGKINYYCNLSTNLNLKQKPSCIIQKFNPVDDKIVERKVIEDYSAMIQKFSDLQDDTGYFHISADADKINGFKHSLSQKLQIFSKETDEKIADIKILYTYGSDIKKAQSQTNLVVVKSEGNANTLIDIANNKTTCNFVKSGKSNNSASYKCLVYTANTPLEDLDAVKKLAISSMRVIKPKAHLDIQKDKYYIIDLTRKVPTSGFKGEKIEIYAQSNMSGNRVWRKQVGDKYEIVEFLTSSYQTTNQVKPLNTEKNLIFLGDIEMAAEGN